MNGVISGLGFGRALELYVLQGRIGEGWAARWGGGMFREYMLFPDGSGWIEQSDGIYLLTKREVQLFVK